VNILNEQSRNADNGRFSNLGVDEVLKTSYRKNWHSNGSNTCTSGLVRPKPWKRDMNPVHKDGSSESGTWGMDCIDLAQDRDR
jgi:hypothetical protein